MKECRESVLALSIIMCNYLIIFSSYSIDVYSNILGEEKVYLLRFISKPGSENEFIPPFIDAIKNVKNEKCYRLRSIAKKDK